MMLFGDLHQLFQLELVNLCLCQGFALSAVLYLQYVVNQRIVRGDDAALVDFIEDDFLWFVA